MQASPHTAVVNSELLFEWATECMREAETTKASDIREALSRAAVRYLVMAVELAVEEKAAMRH
jgi:hypothetical protein